jgi:type IV secretion system protein TrbI
MSDEVIESGLNAVGKYLIAGAAVLVVGATVYGVMNSGLVTTVPDSDAAAIAADQAINLDQLREAAEPKPTPVVRVLPMPLRIFEPQPVAASTPQPAQQPKPVNPMVQWRLQKQMKALEAPVMVAAFEVQGDHHVRELPTHSAAMDSVKSETHLHPPVSPFTIMEGAHISAVLISGINSDFPGPITAQVEQPLYDSATGHYLLIPQGSRVIGEFRQPSGYQDRIQILWHRLIFPDTSSLDLPQMPATDPQGYAGATGDVNSHYLSMFGTAALMSLVTAGQALGSIVTFGGNVSPYNGGLYQTNPMQQVGSVASSNAAAQMGNVGNRMLQRGLDRPKTVIIPSGLPFDIFVTADLVLPGPYVDQAGTTTVTAQR